MELAWKLVLMPCRAVGVQGLVGAAGGEWATDGCGFCTNSGEFAPFLCFGLSFDQPKPRETCSS